MLIITDEDVPDSVAKFLASRGHTVLLTREHFLPKTADSVIARAASERRAVVVTWNRRHFKSLAKRRRKDGTLSYPGMSVIAFRCSHTEGLARIQRLIEEVEAVHAIRVDDLKDRMVVEITLSVLRIED